jgi:hypothetical protein
MTGKVFHLANKTVLDLTHDEVKYFIDITDAQAISGENKDNKRTNMARSKNNGNRKRKPKEIGGCPLQNALKS